MTGFLRLLNASWLSVSSYQNQTAMQVSGQNCRHSRFSDYSQQGQRPAEYTAKVSIQALVSWDAATMDRIIPAALVISLSASWRSEPEYNAVYVSGNPYRSGRQRETYRIPQAINPAPDIYEDSLTETQVNTERGRNELAKGRHQSITTHWRFH